MKRKLTADVICRAVVELEHEGLVWCHARLVEPPVGRFIPHLVPLVAVMRKHHVRPDEILLGETAVVQEGEWAVLVRPGKCAPQTWTESQLGLTKSAA